MNLRYCLAFSCIIVSFLIAPALSGKTTRQERKLIKEGNELYNSRKYVEAQSLYEQAIKENPESAEARYNLGLSQLRQVSNPQDSTPKAKELMASARKNFTDIAGIAKTKPGLAAKANYNLGNIEFNSKEYQKAIDYYKQALRIDPTDDRARKNLRIAQKNLQKQNQDQNQNNQQQDKDNEQDKQDKENNKDQNKDQNQNQDKKQEEEQNKLSQQTASQILQAIDNKESATRARVNKANKGEKAVGSGSNNRKW